MDLGCICAMHCSFIVPSGSRLLGSRARGLHLCDALFVHCARWLLKKTIQGWLHLSDALFVHCASAALSPNHSRVMLHLFDALFVHCVPSSS